MGERGRHLRPEPAPEAGPAVAHATQVVAVGGPRAARLGSVDRTPRTRRTCRRRTGPGGVDGVEGESACVGTSAPTWERSRPDGRAPPVVLVVGVGVSTHRRSPGSRRAAPPGGRPMRRRSSSSRPRASLRASVTPAPAASAPRSARCGEHVEHRPRTGRSDGIAARSCASVWRGSWREDVATPDARATRRAPGRRRGGGFTTTRSGGPAAARAYAVASPASNRTSASPASAALSVAEATASRLTSTPVTAAPGAGEGEREPADTAVEVPRPCAAPHSGTRCARGRRARRPSRCWSGRSSADAGGGRARRPHRQRLLLGEQQLAVALEDRLVLGLEVDRGHGERGQLRAQRREVLADPGDRLLRPQHEPDHELAVGRLGHQQVLSSPAGRRRRTASARRG